MTKNLLIEAYGAVTPIGLNALQSCSALRAGITGFSDVYPLVPPNEPIVGAAVPGSFRLKRTPQEWLVNLAVRGIKECLPDNTARAESLALILSLPDEHRNHPAFNYLTPGEFLNLIHSQLGYKFHKTSMAMQEGRGGIFSALLKARELITNREVDACIVGGVDSFLNPIDIEVLQASYRISGPKSTQGLIPGEGAAFVLVSAGKKLSPSGFRIFGVGISMESDTVLGPKFSQGRGLERALKGAINDSNIPESEISFRISSMNGERYYAWESLLAECRFYRTRRERLPCWYTGASVGDLGAAAGPLSIIVCAIGIRKGYAPGQLVMCEGASDNGLRGACLLGAQSGGVH